MQERKVILRGDRVALTEMTADDQPFFHKWHGENPELRSLIDDHTVPSLEDQLRWFERSRQSDRKIFSIVRREDEVLLGHGGLVEIDTKEQTAKLRITLGNSEEWGKGYGTEATRLIVRYGFEVLGLHTISLRVLSSNTRAIRSYEKAGFEKGSSSNGNLWMQIRRNVSTERGDVPASAITYVRNGGPAFEKCLQSAQFCKEHVILDGGSTDDTLALAEKYHCRVFKQDTKNLNAEGRIVNFAGVANQAYAETREPWIVLIAADEELEDVLIQSMTEVIQKGEKGAYFVNRYFLLDGKVMEYSSLTPEHHLRLCHRDLLIEFRKPVHERPILAPGTVPQVLPRGRHYIPLIETPRVMKEKYRRYLALEEQNFVSFGWLRWMRYALRRLLIMGVLMARMLKIRLLHASADCLPLRYDMLNIWYGWQLIKRSCPFRRISRTRA